MRPILKQQQNDQVTAEENTRDILMVSAVCFSTITLVIILFGMTMLYSTSFGTAGSGYFLKQLMWFSIGMTGLAGILFFGYKRVSDWSPWMMIGIWLLLLIADVCFPAVNGAHRWIKIPGIGNIQPSEYAKVIITLFLGKYLSDRMRQIEKTPFRTFFFGGIFCGLVIVMVALGKDLGTSTLLSLLFLGMMYIAGITWKLIVPLLALAAGGAFAVIMAFDPMRRARITTFINPEPMQAEDGYQLWNSMLALGSGGWNGVGFTESRMKMKYLPEAHTDFILSIVGEELGIISMLAVIASYLLFLFFSMRIARHARTRQGMLIAGGCSLFIILQAFINIGVICGALPTKGMPAPFISYGGSSLVTCLIASGLILSIAIDGVYPDYQNLVRIKIHEIIERYNPLKKKENTI